MQDPLSYHLLTVSAQQCKVLRRHLPVTSSSYTALLRNTKTCYF